MDLYTELNSCKSITNRHGIVLRSQGRSYERSKQMNVKSPINDCTVRGAKLEILRLLPLSALKSRLPLSFQPVRNEISNGVLRTCMTYPNM